MKTADSKEIMDEYLRDESRKTGTSDKLFFPESEDDIISILKENPGVPITIQGARTGLTAGCVPKGGLTINLERMNRILNFHSDAKNSDIIVQPGLLLQTLRRCLLPYKLFFPPDPTEVTASLGGMVSCNSSGARSFRYGAVRNYVLALDVILPDGDQLHLERGRTLAKGNEFHLSTHNKREIYGTLPNLQMPQVKKHTAGYFIRENMDLIDLFIGAEGTLGIITAIQLKLLPQKKETWGSVMFLPSENSALKLVKCLRGESGAAPALLPEAIEFFGCDTLKLLRRAQLSKTALSDMELIRKDTCCAVYVEYAADDRKPLIQAFDDTCEILETVGGDPYRTWAAINPCHMEKLKRFRHAAPECINRMISERKKIDPAITKLGTDMSVPDHRLDDVFSLYRSGLAAQDFDSALFGHIGNNHIHVNIIPKTMGEFYRGKERFAGWAKEIVAMGGTVSAEHGIGKLKTALLKELYSKEQLASMLEVKKRFDPNWILNRGNIFEYENSKA